MGNGSSSNQVLVVIGVGGMGKAIVRRLGPGKTVVLADFSEPTLNAVAEEFRADGQSVETRLTDVSDPESVAGLASFASELGSVVQVAHTAGLSPVQASVKAILAVDLVGVALVLDAFGEVIASGGAGVVIASMGGHMFDALTPEQETALTVTPTAELASLPFTQEITDGADAYRLSKRANHLRVQSASADWGARGATINTISPGIISTQMGREELDGPHGENMRSMVAASSSGRIGTPEDIAAATAFLMGPDGSFLTGTDLLVDGGVIASIRSGRLEITDP